MRKIFESGSHVLYTSSGNEAIHSTVLGCDLANNGVEIVSISDVHSPVLNAAVDVLGL
jgi:hypothetical protein